MNNFPVSLSQLWAYCCVFCDQSFLDQISLKEICKKSGYYGILKVKLIPPTSTMHKLILRSSTHLENSFMNILINLKSSLLMSHTTKNYKSGMWKAALPYCCKLTCSVLKICNSWWQPWTQIIQLGEWVGNSFTYLEFHRWSRHLTLLIKLLT